MEFLGRCVGGRKCKIARQGNTSENSERHRKNLLFKMNMQNL